MLPLQGPALNSSRKRKKGSGLTGLELRMAYDYIRQIRINLKEISLATNEDDDAANDPQLQEVLVPMESEFEQSLDTMLLMMESKLNGPHALSFSGITSEHMEHLNIWQRGFLTLKTDCESLVTRTEEVGKTEHWSSEGLYQHLCMLQGLVPKANEAAARLWINAFFFRAATMSPPGQKMVLSIEQDVSATVKPHSFTTIGGYIDYTAVTASPIDAALFLRHPTLQNLKKHEHTLFVSEAKSQDIPLDKHIPQAVCEMYACARKLGKTTIRGALTDGQKWIFFILKMNPDGNGAIYAESEQFPLISAIGFAARLSRDMCTAISGIIAHWIEHSNEDIDDNDWFTVEWKD